MKIKFYIAVCPIFVIWFQLSTVQDPVLKLFAKGLLAVKIGWWGVEGRWLMHGSELCMILTAPVL